ncbi:MAG: SDR family NAD(P)-dependent oxidoreductase [Nocardia sp.]|nr:SDR family NAD(P)-dependent oxidoreductase [Nocardia sp.]
MRAAGKVFIVTGAGNGIGRHVAQRLIACGATVAGADVDEAGLAQTAALVEDPSRFTAHVLDVSDRAAVAAFPATVLAAHGHIDGLFNIAGIAQEFELVGEISDERIDTLFQVNFFGTVWLTRAVLPHLRERPAAVIMNTSSLSAMVSVPGSAIYGATKAAVASFGYGLSQDLRKSSAVTVTTVFPGAVWTDIVRKSALALGTSEKLARSFSAKPEVAARRMVDATLDGRVRVVIGKDARVYDVVGRLSTRLADKMSYGQLRRFVYKPANNTADR